MATFSQRMGLTPLQKPMQIDSLDQATRNRIWNTIYCSILAGCAYFTQDRQQVYYRYEKIWNEHLKLPPNTISKIHHQHHLPFDEKIQKIMENNEWFEVLNFLEFIVQNFSNEDDIKEFNSILESENTGYRIIDQAITPITNSIEIESIEQAIRSPYHSTNAHIENALKLLSDRKLPDFRNSIKESISAVEAICKIIANDEKGTLGTAIAEIANKHPIPGGLKKALNALYGYTSNESGIRHSLTEESVEPTFADAKFMLVSCTAFVNYLLTIAAEENISFDAHQSQ